MKITKGLALTSKTPRPPHATGLSTVVTVDNSQHTAPTLLTLPAELRNRIYFLALAGVAGPEHDLINVTKEDIEKRADILRTSRQVYREAKDVLLKCFRFRIQCGYGITKPAVKWLGGFDTNPTRINAYEIIFDSADTLRHRYASSFRHLCLEFFSNRIAERVRAKSYKVRYELFVDDFLALKNFFRTHLNMWSSPGQVSPFDWKLYAPIARLQLRIDEYFYIDMIETVLKDGGWIR